MRTTVDIDPKLLDRAKRIASAEQRTVSAVLSDALVAYLGSRKSSSQDGPFELLVRGSSKGRFPTPAEIEAVEGEEDRAALGLPRQASRAAP